MKTVFLVAAQPKIQVIVEVDNATKQESWDEVKILKTRIETAVNGALAEIPEIIFTVPFEIKILEAVNLKYLK